ncbi:response regulator transcription factor [Clostridium sp. 1001271B_151109_B4]|uniref:helix-turn-helix transcriptional regulator n=1 Tax=Clostridium sp. 1001271B_151109_B4 TaxID=2787148 RepID=UPI0018A8D822|nr:response regulator transcription factor [Clostridium sp. 1001271B_151109_B4]
MKISILCRYPVIHEGIKSILKTKYEDITSFTSIEDCLKTLDSTENQSLINTEDTILIVTLFKEDLKIIDNILAIKDNYSKLKLLIIDFTESKDMFFKVSKLNVEGYMLGTFAQEDINYALHKISTGTKFYDRELLYRLVEDEPAATITSRNNLGSPLTRRELEILSQLSNGLSNFEIAKNLTISENTVKKHISNIFIKINVKDRTQAIIYAYESGLIAKPLFL